MNVIVPEYIDKKTSEQSNVITDNTKGRLSDSLQKANVAKDELINISKTSEGIDVKELNDGNIEIIASDLFAIDNIIESNNKTEPAIRSMAKRLHEMLKDDINISIWVKTFVNQAYLKNRMKYYPKSDIWEWSEAGVSARSTWAVQRLSSPDNDSNLSYEQAEQIRTSRVDKYNHLSDEHDLIYTIKFNNTK